MNGLLNRIYGFDELGFGTEDAAFGFAVPPAAWVWAIVVSAAIGLAVAIYARRTMHPAAKWAAAACRALLLVLLALLAFGPRLEKPRTRTTEDRVLYLVDRSASMTVTDGAGISRDEQLRAILDGNAETLAEIDTEKDARWYAFGDALARIDIDETADTADAADTATDREPTTAVAPDNTDPSATPAPTLADAADSATRLGSALARLVAENAGNPISAIVLFSDGRATDPLSRETGAMLSQAGVPVLAVPLGSPDREPDLALTGAVAPSIAFVNDTVPVTVSLNAGGPNDPASAGGTVEIVDTATGSVLESAELTDADMQEGEITLPVTVGRAGPSRWSVRIIPDGPDLSPTNNETTLDIRFVDDPIRVLYLDGAPRWEQRYLKTMLIREDSIDASCLLLATDRRFQQEGNTILGTLPKGDEAWDEFDLVILGDLRPELIGERAARAIRTQVGERSTGLLWLAGPSANPHAWGASPAGDLLPVRVGTSNAALPTWAEPVVFATTPASDRLGIFRELVRQEGVARPDAGWSRLRWAVRVDPGLVKPSAEPLALAIPASGITADADPLVLGMRYGSGRTAFVATDEIWRWRYGRGETATERFWLPLIRHLARPRLAGLGSGVRLETSSKLVPVGQQVVVELTVTDRATAEVLPDRIAATAAPEPPSRDAPAAFTLIRDESGDGPARYRGAFTPVRPGSFRVRVAGDALLPEGLAERVEVISPDDELRSPQTDHPLLASLAESTGGRTLRPEAFAELPGMLPNRRVITPLAPETRTLWDHPVPLAILLTLASAEWIIRRRSRLP